MLRKKAANSAASLTTSELTALVRAVAADEGLWTPRLKIPRDGERWWTRILGDPAVDVWLLSWLPGHSTDLHDHGASVAAFTVVRGQLGELRQRVDGHLHAVTHTVGSVADIAPGV